MKFGTWAHCYSGISIKRTPLEQKKVSALERYFLRFDCKADQSVPRHTVRLVEVSALLCVPFIEIPLYYYYSYYVNSNRW